MNTTRKLVSALAAFGAALSISAAPASATPKPTHPKLAAECRADLATYSRAAARWEPYGVYGMPLKTWIADTNLFGRQLWQIDLHLMAAKDGNAEQYLFPLVGRVHQYAADLASSATTPTQLAADLSSIFGGPGALGASTVCQAIAN